MAKQKGIIPLVGTLGGINFYMRKGKPVARKAGGGFSSDSHKKGKNMERVRESNSEFGDCSRIKKRFKDCLFAYIGMQKDEDLQGRLMQLFLKIKDCDTTSERGKRQVSLGLQYAEGKKLLTEFAFTPFNPDFLQGVYDAVTYTYSITNFDYNQLKYPNGATHLEIHFGVMVFDFEVLKATLFSSAPISISKGTPLTNFSLSPTDEPSGNGIKIAVLAYRYKQELNGEVYALKDKVAYGLRVIEIGN